MHPELAAVASRQGGVFTPVQARSVGYSLVEIRATCRRGEWHPLGQGVYCTRDVHIAAADDPRAAHALRVWAALLVLNRPAVASHESAAILLGLDLLRRPDGVTLTAADGGHRTSALAVVHQAELPPDHVSGHSPPTTSLARTVVDVARLLPFLDAVIVADSALRLGQVSKDELTSVVRACAGWPGVRRASRAVGFADGRSEVASESLARVVFAELGLPVPELQVPIFDHRGLIGYVDFLFRKQWTVGEVDGRRKYVKRPGNEDPERVLWREKQREDRLREADYEVVRVTWGQLMRERREVGRRFHAAFARAERRRRAS